MKETKIFAVIEEKKGFTIRYDRQNQKWYVIDWSVYLENVLGSDWGKHEWNKGVPSLNEKISN